MKIIFFKSSKLELRDCLALAHHKFEIEDFHRSLLWFQEALNVNTIRVRRSLMNYWVLHLRTWPCPYLRAVSKRYY